MGLQDLERTLRELEGALERGEYGALEGFSQRLKEGMEEARRAHPQDLPFLQALLERSKRCEALILKAMEDHRRHLQELKVQRTSLRGYGGRLEERAFFISKRF